MTRRSARWSLPSWALLAAVVTTGTSAPLHAQESLPEVQVRQVLGGGSFAFSGTGRLQLDRPAFLVVFEIGADGRARVLYPMSPRASAFTRSDRPVYVPLPSADVPFIQAAELRIPVIVAFASDVEPNLSEFTESGRRWDYQYASLGFEPIESTVRGLAELLYGSADMPFTVATRDLSPVLSMSAQRSLNACGYQFGNSLSRPFNQFLWDLWGPMSLLETSWNIDRFYQEMQWGQWGMGGGTHFFAPPWFSFARTTSRGLWNQFGAGCDPLRRDFRYIAFLPEQQNVPLPPGAVPPIVPPPADRPATPPPSGVDDVGIQLAAPIDMARRSASVSRQSAALATSRATASRAPLARETNRDLVQRQEIERTIALISAQRAVGRGGSVAEAFERVRAGQFEGDMMRVAERQSGGGRLTTRRANGSDPFSSMRGSGSSSGSSGASGGGSTSGSGSGSGSVGSGSSGGGGEGRGGAGSARGGTGRPGGL